MTPMIGKKGSNLMLIVIVGLITTILVAGIITGAFGRVAVAVLGRDMACPTFCAYQADIEEYSGWDFMLPSHIDLIGHLTDKEYIKDSSGAAANMIADMLIQPEGLGCYCGVQERSGKYIHIYTRGAGSNGGWDGNIGEFHLTDQNPEKHLKYDVSDVDGESLFRHKVSSAEDDCAEAVEEMEDVGSFSGLDNYPACVILSTDSGGDCSLWTFQENFTIKNERGKTLEGQAKSYQEESDDFNYNVHGEWQNDLVSSLEVGDTVENRGGTRHPSQRLLLRNYLEGDSPFEFFAPVVCRTTTREGREAETRFDDACRRYCEDEEEVFWSSACLVAPRQGYQMLDEEYYEEPLCEEPDESPYCLCMEGKEYYWEVDEEYEF